MATKQNKSNILNSKKNQKVLLIQPPMTLLKNEIKSMIFPLGLAYIAAVLEKEKYDVKTLDCVALGCNEERTTKEGMIHFGLFWNDIERKIREIKPDLVGISCLFSSQSNNSYKVAEIVKKVDKNIKIIFGGAHPSSIPKEVMQNKNIDFIVIGEGDETIAELVKNINNNDKLKKIDGLAFRLNGKIIINPKTKYIADINSLPMPARHLFPFKIYLESQMGHGSDLMRKPLTSMITSRGCPFNCVFCSVQTVWGRSFRKRDPIKVVDEIEYLVKNFGIREIHFEDDNLTLDKQRMITICKEILRRKIDIKWTTPNGVAIWTLDKEVLGYMKKAGCYKLCFGVESANIETQKFIRKRINLEKSKEVIREANKLGIWTHGFFVIGFPFETKESINDTLKFSYQSDLDFASFFLATPYPKTELYEIMKKNGMVKNLTWESLRVSTASIRTKYFSSKELIELQRKMFLKSLMWKIIYSFNPVSTFYRIRKIKSKEDFKFIMRYVKRFLQIV